MTLEEAKAAQETKVINLAAQTWNEALKIEGLPEYDIRVLNELVHRIQDMMYQRLFIKMHGNV